VVSFKSRFSALFHVIAAVLAAGTPPVAATTLAIAAAAAMLAAPSAYAQTTLGGITGTVLDPAGSAIPGATVTAVSDDTKLIRTTKSNAEGSYQLVDLPIGKYTITITMAGFTTEKIPSIAIQADRTVTLPAKLALGGASDSVTVELTPLMNAVDTTNGYVLDKAQIETIPLPTGSFTGLATQSPGVNAELPGGTGANSGLGNSPIWANGQRDTSNTFLINGVDASNLFNGKSTSQSGGSRVINNTGVGNTGGGGAVQSGASIYLAIGNALPTPAPETIQEIRVNASMYDASQGSTSGAHIDVSTASGTNDYHGQLYFRHGSNDLNAAPFFFKNDPDVPANDKNPELHRYTLGGTFGGPLVKNKLFAFVAYQHVHISDQETGDSFLDVPAGLTDTNRTAAGLSGLINTNFGSGSTAAGISPVALFLFNYKLPNGQFMIPSQTAGVVPSATHPDNAFITGRSYFISDQMVADVDYNASAKDTLAVKYYYQSDPSTAPFAYSNVPGFTEHTDDGAQVFSISNTYLLKSNLSSTQTLGFDRMHAFGTNEQPFTAQTAGINSFGSSYFPGISIIDVLGNDNAGGQNPDGLYNQSLNIGPGAFTQGPFTGVYQNRLMPSGNALWVLGKHSIGFGGNWSYTQLNIRDQRTGKGMIATQDFGNFAQGNIAAQNSSFTTTTFLVGNANRYYRSNQVGSFVQDKFQVKPNLSLTAGIRYDWDGGLTEKNGDIFNFDPSKYSFNTACLSGTDDNPADCYPTNGIVIAGNNAQGTPGASKTTLKGRQWGFGPRLGVAWQPKIFDSKFVVRAGTGIYYDRGENFSFFSAGYAIGEVTGGPFGAAQAPPFVNAVQCNPSGNPNGTTANYATPGATCDGNAANYSLSTPFGAGTAYIQPSGKAASITQYLQTPDQIINGGQLTTLTVYDQNNKLPYTINYTLDVQWQPLAKFLVEVGYVGNLARHQVIPVPLNQAQVATPNAPVNGQSYSYGNSVQTAGNSFCYYACSPAQLPNGQNYLSNYEGGNVDLRVPYLGYAAESEIYKAAGIADYNALQVHVEQRLSHGFIAGASYTYSHALDEQSDLGLFYTGNNALNLRSGYGSADFDRTHVLNANVIYKIPSPYPPESLAGKFTAGWSLTSLLTFQSGQPYSVIDFSGAVGSLYYSSYDGITNPVVPLAPGFTPKSARQKASGAFYNGTNSSRALNPAAFTLPLLTGPTVTAANTAAYGIPGPTTDAPNGDPYETTFTSGQRNIFRQTTQDRADLSIIKELKVKDRYMLRYTFDIFNLTNHASFDIPSVETTQNSGYNPTPSADQPVNDGSSSSFYSSVASNPSNLGVVQHTIGSARQIQMSLKMTF
jgi:hypothetical protein